jgi:acyl carrier protein
LSHRRPSLDVPLISPQNVLEKIIADAWKSVLQLDEVSVDDNFFDLGGHSLLMLQIKRCLESELKVEIAPVDMFEYPTVRTLAQYLSGLQKPASAIASGHARGMQQRELQQQSSLERAI